MQTTKLVINAWSALWHRRKFDSQSQSQWIEKNDLFAKCGTDGLKKVDNTVGWIHNCTIYKSIESNATKKIVKHIFPLNTLE